MGVFNFSTLDLFFTVNESPGCNNSTKITFRGFNGREQK